MKSAQIKKIFVGANPLARKILGSALAPEFDLMHCDNLDQAKPLLMKPVDLILCTVLFDGSRMFDLLRYVKNNPAAESIPFVGIRVVQGTLPFHEVVASRAAVKLLGGDEFLDMYTWMNELGEDRAFEKLRTTIHQLL